MLCGGLKEKKNARRGDMCGRMIYYRAQPGAEVMSSFFDGRGWGWFGDEMRINLASERRRG